MRTVLVVLLIALTACGSSFTPSIEGTWVFRSTGFNIDVVVRDGEGFSCAKLGSVQAHTPVDVTFAGKNVLFEWRVVGWQFSGKFTDEHTIEGVLESENVVFRRGEPIFSFCKVL